MASVLTLPAAQEQFIDIVRRLESKSLLPQLLEWIRWNWKTDLENKTSFEAAEEMLTDIASDLRSVLPAEGTLQTENLRTPSAQEKADYDPKHTLHVDAFLYDDELVDSLCDEGKLARSYCLQCGSYNTKPLTYISHSLPKEQLAYIFQAMLPVLDGKVMLDIGSRLGAVLYGAYLYSSAVKIVGVEINAEFCSLQMELIKKYKFQDRIEVVEANIMDRGDIVQAADVIVMNNVFQFFMNTEQQSVIWRFMRATVRPGTLLVTNPPLEQALSSLQTGIDLRTWVEELPLYNPEAAGVRITAEDAQDLRLYRVLTNT